MFFADLVGSVPMAARLDPEDWGEVIAQYHALAASVIERFGGSVKQYLGDGVLACFGHPVAHEDDAARAVRAGLELVEAVNCLDPRIDGATLSSLAQGSGSPPALRLRVGIHTGVSLVADGPLESGLFGDTPNIAARVQGEAETDSVLVTEATLQLIENQFVVEPRGLRHLKGVRAPMALHRIVRALPTGNRLEARAARLAPFVGRDSELARIAEAWQRTRAGAGRAILIRSEPGVGKSRLLYQFHRRVEADRYRTIEFRCTSLSQGTAFRPLVTALERHLGFRHEDSDAVKIGKLARALERLDLSARDHLPFLAELLGLDPAGGYEPAKMSAAFKRALTLDSATRWHLRLARQGPLLLLVEDLHWCDPSSLEFFGRLVKDCPEVPLLILLTARFEFENPWPSSPDFETLDLGRLSPPDARTIVIGIGAPAVLPERVIDRIVARADGVPLYLEELTKVVAASADSSGLDPDIEVPTTLQDSLMARLDRLSTARLVAQRVAVLGRDFGYRLAAASLGLDEGALREGLERLVQSDVLRQDGEPPDAHYQFKHALLQESAYGSLLRRTRVHLHGHVLDVLLSRFGEQIERSPELAARHAEAAHRTDTAIQCYRRAGLQAQERSAHEEAIGHLRRAISLLAESPRPHRDRIELPLQLALGASLTAARGYAHSERRAAYQRGCTLAEAVGDRDLLGEALIGLSIFHCVSGEMERARGLAERVLHAAEQDGRRQLALHGHCQVALPEHYQGRFASSLHHCEEALAIYDPTEHHRAAFLIGGDTGIAAMAVSAWNLWYLGFPDRALTRARETIALAVRLEHPFGIGFSNCALAIVHWLRGEFEAQQRAARRQIAVGREYGFPVWLGLGQLFHGAASLELGDRSALEEARQGLSLAATTGTRSGAPLMLTMLASAQGRTGAIADALGTIDLGLAVARETGQPFQDAELRRLQGELTLLDARIPIGERSPRAEEAFRAALAIARSQGSRALELRALMSLADLPAPKERRLEMRAPLVVARDAFREGADTADLRRAGRLLEELA